VSDTPWDMVWHMAAQMALDMAQDMALDTALDTALDMALDMASPHDGAGYLCPRMAPPGWTAWLLLCSPHNHRNRLHKVHDKASHMVWGTA